MDYTDAKFLRLQVKTPYIMRAAIDPGLPVKNAGIIGEAAGFVYYSAFFTFKNRWTEVLKEYIVMQDVKF